MTFQTFSPSQYLAIDIANNFGLDKKDWDERLSWFNENVENLDSLIQEADEPALFYAGIQAWKAYKNNEPSGYMISLDATSSGLQLLAVLTGDEKAASLCNVIDTGKREDAYTSIYLAMLELLGEKATITRDDTKQAIMTSLYSSKAVPKQIFGEGILLHTFYSTISSMAPGAWALNEAMLNFWNPEAYSHNWVLPDNFHVNIKVMDRVTEKVHFLNTPFDVYYNVNQPMEGGRSLGANLIHSLDGMIVREMTRRCSYDPNLINYITCIINNYDWDNPIPTGTSEDDYMVELLWKHYEETNYLSARILNHLSNSNLIIVDRNIILNLIDSLPNKPFTVISVHDCFRCHPNYGNDLREQYINQLAEIANSNLLSWLLTQITGREINITKGSKDLHNKIKNTNYALS